MVLVVAEEPNGDTHAGKRMRSVGLEKNARCGLERAAQGDQPACLREIDPRVLGRQRRAGGVEAEGQGLAR